MPFCLHMIDPPLAPNLVLQQHRSTHQTQKICSAEVIHVHQLRAQKYFSLTDTVRMETRDLFILWLLSSEASQNHRKDLTTAIPLSCDWYYQHGEALAGFGNNVIWCLQIWKENAAFFQKPCTHILWGLSWSEIKTLEYLMQLSCLRWGLLPHFFINCMHITQTQWIQ